MDPVDAEVDRSPWLEKIMGSDSALRGEVPNARIGVGAGLRGVCGIQIAHCRILMVGPDDATGSLNPWDEATSVGEVPTHLDRCDADAGVGAADRIGRAADRARSGFGATDALKFGGVGLPEREDFYCVFKVAAKKACSKLWGKDFSCVNAR